MAVCTALMCFASVPATVHVYAAAGEGVVTGVKSLIPAAEKEKMREALETLRELGYSPMDIVQHLLNGEDALIQPDFSAQEIGAEGSGLPLSSEEEQAQDSQSAAAMQENSGGLMEDLTSLAQDAGDEIIGQVQDAAQDAGDEIIGQVQDAAQAQAESWAEQMKDTIRTGIQDFIDGIMK